MIQELIKALTNITAPNTDAERASTAISTINEVLKPKVKVKAKG